MAITTKRGQPITGSRAAMKSRKPVLSDAAHPSRDAQRIVPRPPMPFENPQGSVNVPALANRAERFSGNNATEGRTRWLRSSSASIRSGSSLTADQADAIGYGVNDTKSSNPIISGRPLQNRTNSTGPSSQPRATGGNGQNTRRTSQAVPGRETGSARGDYQGNRQYTDPTGNRFANGAMYTDGVKKGSHARGASLTQRPAPKKGEAPFYGQR
jgi:hypothetical protein